MRRTVAAAVSSVAIATPIAQATAATRHTTTSTAKKTLVKKVTGISAVADRWGTVQVSVTAKIVTSGGKTTIRYTDLGGTYSYHTDRSQYIMSQSLPALRQEFLSVQGANVQSVSGASATSAAFEQSLQSALNKLRP
jgi:uncharacterized protein with FMN-binding domain